MKFGTKSEPNPDAVIAEPTNGGDDSMKIVYEDFKKEYDYALKRAGVEDDTDESIADSCKTQRNTIITYLINERIIMKKASEMGLSTLTEEEMNAVEEEYNSNIEEQIEAFGKDRTTAPQIAERYPTRKDASAETRSSTHTLPTAV